MRTARVLLAGHWLSVWVAETAADQMRGLQGFPPLADDQGMLFVGPDGHFAMRSVDQPLDLLFFTGARLARVVTVAVGDPRVWASPGSTSVVEVAGGWTRRHGVRLGDPILASSLP